MPPLPLRLYHPKGPDRAAIVAVEPSATTGFLIRLARGSGPGPLKKGTVLGPFAASEIDARFAEVVKALHAEGFAAAGRADLLLGLQSPRAEVRARAALGLGWRKATEAVEPILAAFPKAVDEVCSFLDALGFIGDARALPLLREQASRKLLSRRRSAVEALRNMGDMEGLAVARQQALERLPTTVRAALEADRTVEEIVKSLAAVEIQQRGLALDTLYELADPLAVAVVRTMLTQVSFDQPHLWRYVKSVFKRAMLRRDYDTFGWLSHAIEIQARTSTGTPANVKSGYDGVARSVRIFARKTQVFLRRLTWRYLRTLAIHRPGDYTEAAARVLAAYAPEDAEDPQGFYGEFAGCYALNRILWGQSTRLMLNERNLRFRFRSATDAVVPEQAREEPYQALWDAYPHGYLVLLSTAKLPDVHAFAVRAIARHPNLLHQATHAEVVALLQAPYEPTVRLGLEELKRRFDPHHPDWLLLEQLLRDERPAARELGENWLRLTSPLWLQNADQILAWLRSPSVATRSLAADIAATGLTDATLRTVLAGRLWDFFRQAPASAEGLEAMVHVAQSALVEEFHNLLSLSDVLDWIERGPVPTLSLAGALLARHPEAVTVAGLARLANLAQHDIAAVRAAAVRLLEGAVPLLRIDPSLLFILAESAWVETRRSAVALLRAILQPEALGLETLTGLLDSNQIEVQELGKELAMRGLASLPVQELVGRLVQHPHPNMRRFALDLVVQHLPDNAAELASLDQFFRGALFDLWPERVVKQRVLDFLIERGLRAEGQARVVVPILTDVVRMQGRADFEHALEGLVRIKLAFPEVASPVTLQEEAV